MKTLILLPLAVALILTGCGTPQPVIVERHHHHYTNRPVDTYKASPSVSSESASGFRAVEKAD